jgi:hypothetical protein
MRSVVRNMRSQFVLKSARRHLQSFELIGSFGRVNDPMAGLFATVRRVLRRPKLGGLSFGRQASNFAK